jgi:Na+-transporting methylmalonyl-CoA/oxaloacetate decarboxylase gamma subunit
MIRKIKENTKNKLAIVAVALVFICLFLIVHFTDSTSKNSNTSNSIQHKSNEKDSAALAQESQKQREEFLKAASAESDDTCIVIHVSNPEDASYTIDSYAGKSIKRVFNGRRINIAITGLDNRLGTSSNHADANHVLSILIDSAAAEIISVPRDTPAEAGMPDTSGQNKLTIVRAVRGREAYHKELARIAGLDKIHYYVEVGFSQVIGILDFLGYKDPRSTLQVLRSRTALGGDDYQRCYNQGQFIRQMLLRHFTSLTGEIGEVLLTGGLSLVNTNLTPSVVKGIISALSQKNFPFSGSGITIKVRPPVPIDYKVYDFTNQNTVDNLQKKIEYKNSKSIDDSLKVVVNVASKLKKLISSAIADTAKHPERAIKTLSIYFEQHAWLQVTDINTRNLLRDEIANILITCYNKKKQYESANKVKATVEAEKAMFSKQIKKINLK